jgi:hypothetical protein
MFMVRYPLNFRPSPFDSFLLSSLSFPSSGGHCQIQLFNSNDLIADNATGLLTASGCSINMGFASNVYEKFRRLTLVTGAFVNTGSGGVLVLNYLYVNSTVRLPDGVYTAANFSYLVTGTGSIKVRTFQLLFLALPLFLGVLSHFSLRNRRV